MFAGARRRLAWVSQRDVSSRLPKTYPTDHYPPLPAVSPDTTSSTAAASIGTPSVIVPFTRPVKSVAARVGLQAWLQARNQAGWTKTVVSTPPDTTNNASAAAFVSPPALHYAASHDKLHYIGGHVVTSEDGRVLLPQLIYLCERSFQGGVVDPARPASLAHGDVSVALWLLESLCRQGCPSTITASTGVESFAAWDFLPVPEPLAKCLSVVADFFEQAALSLRDSLTGIVPYETDRGGWNRPSTSATGDDIDSHSPSPSSEQRQCPVLPRHNLDEVLVALRSAHNVHASRPHQQLRRAMFTLPGANLCSQLAQLSVGVARLWSCVESCMVGCTSEDPDQRRGVPPIRLRVTVSSVEHLLSALASIATASAVVLRSDDDDDGTRSVEQQTDFHRVVIRCWEVARRLVGAHDVPWTAAFSPDCLASVDRIAAAAVLCHMRAAVPWASIPAVSEFDIMGPVPPLRNWLPHVFGHIGEKDTARGLGAAIQVMEALKRPPLSKEEVAVNRPHLRDAAVCPSVAEQSLHICRALCEGLDDVTAAPAAASTATWPKEGTLGRDGWDWTIQLYARLSEAVNRIRSTDLDDGLEGRVLPECVKGIVSVLHNLSACRAANGEVGVERSTDKESFPENVPFLDYEKRRDDADCALLTVISVHFAACRRRRHLMARGQADHGGGEGGATATPGTSGAMVEGFFDEFDRHVEMLARQAAANGDNEEDATPEYELGCGGTTAGTASESTGNGGPTLHTSNGAREPLHGKAMSMVDTLSWLRSQQSELDRSRDPIPVRLLGPRCRRSLVIGLADIVGELHCHVANHCGGNSPPLLVGGRRGDGQSPHWTASVTKQLCDPKNVAFLISTSPVEATGRPEGMVALDSMDGGASAVLLVAAFREALRQRGSAIRELAAVYVALCGSSPFPEQQLQPTCQTDDEALLAALDAAITALSGGMRNDSMSSPPRSWSARHLALATTMARDAMNLFPSATPPIGGGPSDVGRVVQRLSGLHAETYRSVTL